MAVFSRAPKELAEHLMKAFSSSERPLVTLYMDVFAPAHGGPWPPLLHFHGWHGDLTVQRDRARALAAMGWCVLNLNLRGRCGTVGEPDANGWELRDAVDALQAARRDFPQLCSESLPARAFGASGGGGNVYALLGKCPDLLSAAAVWCGISDYARWFEWNEAGNYRDEMQRWIAPNPREFPEAYQSRSGLTVAHNRICPLLVMHGQDDDSVPVGQARAYAEAQKKDAPPFQYRELAGVGHGIPGDPYLAEVSEFLLRHAKPVYVPPMGRYVVAGFLRTHYFEVHWDHRGLVGNLEVDLRRRRVHLECQSTQAAQVRLAGPVRVAELLVPTPRNCRLLSVRQEAGWSIVDLQLHGQRCGLRWKV
jgi:acetyl esterase/lipase